MAQRSRDSGVAADAGELIGLYARIDEHSGGLASIITSAFDEPRRLVAASLDALLDMLRLDFAYATFVDLDTGTSSVVARTPDTRDPAIVRQRIGPAINAYLSEQSQAPRVATGRAGDAQVVRLHFGMHDDTGAMLLGSARNAFPTRTELALLSIVASQLAIGLRGAHLLKDQKRKVLELDRRVARQARELQMANDERRRALERLDELQDRTGRGGDGLREHATLTRGGLTPWQMQRATKLMTANLQEHVPLSQLAARCGLSMRHFARAFRQSTGLPPHRWLLNHRVEHAKELLRNPAMSLVEIALACGFADQSHFTRTFTTVAAVGPGLWRRMQAWRLPLGPAETDGRANAHDPGSKLVAATEELPYRRITLGLPIDQ